MLKQDNFFVEHKDDNLSIYVLCADSQESSSNVELIQRIKEEELEKES